MSSVKLLPVGITDFREILESNYYYIDKTQWIEELFQDGAKVKLFTRPRRFGKTLNMSMLRYFLISRIGKILENFSKAWKLKILPIWQNKGNIL
ncbi:hypothetical protein C095_08925 [Fusobacterium necrophorum subsp. funduliforme B35]|uniref:AAA-ATPase-like domain-containing protein n=1 Tax=Fusobacterium necrophorum subsp. funduliforme B35 TaxID=1226633 RepID=A0A0B4EHN8_9FUSO|nr:hypothetical protein C095_08925 [Fusobacterium necrophorum subsp. funduliforme B35]